MQIYVSFDANICEFLNKAQFLCLQMHPITKIGRNLNLLTEKYNFNRLSWKVKSSQTKETFKIYNISFHKSLENSHKKK